MTTERDEALVRADDPPEICGDFGLLASVTGWRPEIELEDTLRDVLAAALSGEIDGGRPR